MDDELFGNQPKYTPQQAASLKEMARRANDRIRVYNPTIEDFITRWDSMGFRVPSKNKDDGQGFGQAVLPRYVAINYVKHMVDKILGDRMIMAVINENEKRLHSGVEKMNVYEDRLKFESQYRTNDPDSRTKLRKLLWLGVEEEYGLDVQEVQDTRPREKTEEELLAELDKPATKLTKDLPSLPDLGGGIQATQSPQIKIEPDEPKEEFKPMTEVLPVEFSIDNPLTEEKKKDLLKEVAE